MSQPTPPQNLSSPTFRRREWLFVGIVALVAIAWSFWPTYTGLKQAPIDSRYLYTNIPDTSDTQVYFAFIDQNAAGHTLYRNLFTSEPQRAVLFNPLWWLLGTIQRFTGQTPEAVFTAARLVLGGGLVVLLYVLIAHWVHQLRWRAITLLTTVFGGGFGGLFYLLRSGDPRLVWIQTQTPLLQSLPADVTHAAAFTWQAIGHSPLFVAAQLLILGTWLIVWRGGRTWIAMVLAGTLAFIHPYDPVLLLGVLTGQIVFSILRSSINPTEALRRLRTIGWLIVSMIPAGTYYVWAMVSEPIIRQWFRQNILYAPPITSLIAGFGALAILATAMALRRHESSQQLMLVDWLVMSLILSYLPLIPFQAKMVSLMNVPVALLAAMMAQQLWQTTSRHRVWLVVGAGVVALVTFSSVIIFPLRVSRAQTIEPLYHYASNDMIATMQWFQTSTPTDSIILGDYFTDNLVPRYARRTAYIGHNLQTIQFPAKLALIRHWFYGTSGSEVEKAMFLRDAHITYVVWGPVERSRGPFQPELIASLQLVHQQGDVQVYRVGN
jgi:hypothetical protein